MVKILICTPAYGGLCHVGYVHGLLESITTLSNYDIQLGVYFIANESLIPRGRNKCVSSFMKSDHDFLLFIDADISFKALDIVKLVQMASETKNGVVGGLYCKKEYNWDYLDNMEQWLKYKNEEHNKDKSMGQFIREMLSQYCYNPLEEEKLYTDSNYLSVKYLGIGFMMIHRNVFVNLIEKCPELKYNNDISYSSKDTKDDVKDDFYAFFDCCIDPESKKYLSEDFYFCKLIKDKLNIIPIVDLNINLGHNGNYEFRGDLKATMAIK